MRVAPRIFIALALIGFALMATLRPRNSMSLPSQPDKL